MKVTLLLITALLVVVAGQEVGELIADANIAYRNGQLDRAQTLYERVLEREPDNAVARNGLGLVAMARGRYEEALDNLLPLLSGFQHDPNFLFNLGSIYKALGDYPNAIDVLEQALELVPDNPPVLAALAESLLKEGRFDAALPHTRRIVEIKPDNVDYRYLHGMTFFLLDNWVLARENLEKVLGLEPTYLLAYEPLFEAYISLNESEAALSHARRWVDLEPVNGWAWRCLSLARLKRSDLAGGYEAAALMLKYGRVDNELLKIVSHWLRATDRRDEARRLWLRAVEIEPFNMVAHGELERG